MLVSETSNSGNAGSAVAMSHASWYEYRLESYTVVALNPRRQCNGVQVALNTGKCFTRMLVLIHALTTAQKSIT